jgi:hypothetical protein
MPGDLYERSPYLIKGQDKVIVCRHHVDPPCDPPEIDYEQEDRWLEEAAEKKSSKQKLEGIAA